MQFLIGLDLGTSACKAGLFDSRGNLLKLTRYPITLYHPHETWAEQSPAEWWEAACEALRELMASGVDPAHVAGLSLSGQTPGHAMVDSDGRPLGRAMIWQDRRAAAQAAWMSGTFTPEELAAYTGRAFVPDFTSPPARLLWLRDNDPHWEQARWVMQPKDYLALRMTGNAATDIYSAYTLAHGSTGLYDSEYFSRLDLPLDRLPPVLGPTSRVGTVTPLAAQATGLPVGTPIYSGTIDAWCGIIGGGATTWQAVDIAGTSEVVALITPGATPPQESADTGLGWDFGAVFMPTQLGADAIAWLRRTFYPGLDQADYATIEEEASSVAPGCGGLIFLPYLMGERAPIWDDQARGAFVGCTIEHGRPHFARAVYEGGAFVVRHVLSLAEGRAGHAATEVRVGGGGARSDLWNQIKADATGARVARLKVEETCVLGAAMCAAVGLGLYADVMTAGQAMTGIEEWYEPNAAVTEVYDQLFPAYRDLYPALKDISHRISQWSAQRAPSAGGNR